MYAEPSLCTSTTVLTLLKLGFVAGEMKNPIRDVPRVINTAMAIVITGFVLMNIALYVVLPIQFIREREAVAVVLSNPIPFRVISFQDLAHNHNFGE